MYFIFEKINSFGLMGCKMGYREANRLSNIRNEKNFHDFSNVSFEVI
jgi:hypothetical protein